MVGGAAKTEQLLLINAVEAQSISPISLSAHFALVLMQHWRARTTVTFPSPFTSSCCANNSLQLLTEPCLSEFVSPYIGDYRNSCRSTLAMDKWAFKESLLLLSNDIVKCDFFRNLWWNVHTLPKLPVNNHHPIILLWNIFLLLTYLGTYFRIYFNTYLSTCFSILFSTCFSSCEEMASVIGEEIGAETGPILQGPKVMWF